MTALNEVADWLAQNPSGYWVLALPLSVIIGWACYMTLEVRKIVMKDGEGWSFAMTAITASVAFSMAFALGVVIFGLIALVLSFVRVA